MKYFIIDLKAVDANGKSMKNYSFMTFASSLKDLSDSIFNITDHWREPSNAEIETIDWASVYVSVWLWVNGEAKTFFNGRIPKFENTIIL